MKTKQEFPFIPAPGEGKRGEDGCLGYLLRQASVAFRVCAEKALSGADITFPQFLVLTMVNAYPGISNADLARLSLLTPQTVSVIVSNLKRIGMVKSQPHAVHGRIQTIYVTETGKKSLSLCKERVRLIEEQFAAGLSQAEEKVIRKWLARVVVDCGL